ncbi:hypothetical protein EON80_06340 [bacterium]|nr:MAG: hypothetical protein EON80_06340 [bacterium]
MATRTDFTEEELSAALERHRHRERGEIIFGSVWLVIFFATLYLFRHSDFVGFLFFLDPTIGLFIYWAFISGDARDDKDAVQEALRRRQAAKPPRGWLW